MSPLVAPPDTPGFEPPRRVLTAGQALGLLFKALRRWQTEPPERRTVDDLGAAIDAALEEAKREHHPPR